MSATAEMTPAQAPRSATQNACKLCAPLGASMVFKGVQGCLPFLHGSQGCATYIRRYMISHFREPVDIASSSFSEDDAIFGGARNFATGVENVINQYQPEIIGVATTCLSETIGENMIGMIREYQERYAGQGAPLVHVSTPSYSGTHSEGFHAAVKALVEQLVPPESVTHRDTTRLNILPGMVSCADLRHLRELVGLYGLSATLLPDYNQTLEGESWDQYHRISPGGTTLEEIREMGANAATLELGHTLALQKESAGAWLENHTGVHCHHAGLPIGIRLSDAFFTALSQATGRTMPDSLRAERGRLVDAYVDAHKYIAGRRVAIVGEPDLVTSLAAFVSEIGLQPVLCATGSKLKGWAEQVAAEIEPGIEKPEIVKGADHAQFSARCRALQPDMLIGSSKVYPLARELDVPLVRVGFPLHDRFGAQRLLTLGYRGTQNLFDLIVNAVLARRQDDSVTGYSYL
ncbi:MAG: nitrogenase molybdenum-iron protein NifN [Puniceicoccaceae bacterium 5H]|nr:MAG: nitrogenase molybdenum-iron protein NifN [Puniceicoccaceae bacterium 5H]